MRSSNASSSGSNTVAVVALDVFGAEDVCVVPGGTAVEVVPPAGGAIGSAFVDPDACCGAPIPLTVVAVGFDD